MKLVQQFIAANRTAYGKASKVFAAIEAQDFSTTLAEAGIVGPDIRVFATIYVAATSKTGVKPHPSQRGGELVFTKNTSEYNRVKYLVDVATGVQAVRSVKRSNKNKSRQADPVAKLVDAYAALTKAQQRKFLASI